MRSSTTSDPRPDDDGTSASGTWFELSVTVDQEAVEAVSEILGRAAPAGLTVEVPFATTPDGLAAQTTDAPVTLRAYLPALDRAAAERSIVEARERLGHLRAFGLRPIDELQVALVDEEDWASAWMEHFPVMRVGRHFVIRPTWRTFEPAPGDVVLSLDPGMAFGTGLHPTTRLCLAGLERWGEQGLVAGSSVLDVGCGSGILGVGAALLGARRVRAVDPDPVAVESTGRNADRNRVAVDVTRGSLPVAGGPFDLVLANLIASLLVDMAGDLAAAVRPGDGEPGSGGRLLASGIFADREAEVRRALVHAGLHVLARTTETDWVALDLERPGR